MKEVVVTQMDKFRNFGTLLTSDERCLPVIKIRITEGKIMHQKLKSILCNKPLSLGVRKRVPQ